MKSLKLQPQLLPISTLKYFIAFCKKKAHLNIASIKKWRRKWYDLFWQVLTAADTLDAASSAYFDGHRVLWGHRGDMLVISDTAHCLPTSGGCLLLWLHLSHWALMTACDTAPDGLSWPKHFAEAAARSQGQGVLTDSCDYTTHGVSHSRENRFHAHSVWLWTCAHVGVTQWLHVFPRLTYCNKARVCWRISSEWCVHAQESAAAAPNDEVHTTTSCY